MEGLPSTTDSYRNLEPRQGGKGSLPRVIGFARGHYSWSRGLIGPIGLCSGVQAPLGRPLGNIRLILTCLHPLRLEKCFVLTRTCGLPFMGVLAIIVLLLMI